EVPDAVEPRLSVDEIEVIALPVAFRVAGLGKVAIEELLPRLLMHHGRGREHAVEVEQNGRGAGPGGAVFSHVFVSVPRLRRVVLRSISLVLRRCSVGSWSASGFCNRSTNRLAAKAPWSATGWAIVLSPRNQLIGWSSSPITE